MLCTHKTTIFCQFGNLEICPNFANPYLTQFSSISGGNCITRLPNGHWSLPLHHDQTQHHANTLLTPKTQQQLVQWLQPPSVPVLALSSTQSNATSSQLGQASPPTSSDAISPHPTPLLKATSTNNDNANANILVPMNNQSLQVAPALTPSTPPFLTPRPPLAAPTATSPAAFRPNQVAAPTTSS